MPHASDVFGINSRSNPASYVERKIDEEFKYALLTNEYSAIMIYGTSKQGKSSLRRNVLPDPFCTFVSAAAGMTREGLYREVLNQAKVAGPIDLNVEWQASGKGCAKLAMPAWLERFAGISAEANLQRTSRSTQKEIEVDYGTAASVARKYIVEAGGKPVVIDNFHYFSPDLQRLIATDIRAFEEKGIKLVIMGTWKARDYLERANPDLSGRVCALSIEPWTTHDFIRVIEAGERGMNVRFSPSVRDALVTKAAGNIGLLQRGLLALLRRLDIHQAPARTAAISDARLVREVYRDIARELVVGLAGQLRKITEIGESWLEGKTRTYFIVRTFVEDPESDKIGGVDFPRLFRRTNELIRREVGGSEQLSEQGAALLIKRDLLLGQQRLIFTPLIAYDSAEDRVVPLDSWLLFTLRHHRAEILQEL